MTSPSYCNPCFVSLGDSIHPEDVARLEQWLAFWEMGSHLVRTHGLCARCGKEGEVVYHEAPS